jgi:hypothetical protein
VSDNNLRNVPVVDIRDVLSKYSEPAIRYNLDMRKDIGSCVAIAGLLIQFTA